MDVTSQIIRAAVAADYDALGSLMFEAIHDGPSKYTPAQSRAWAPAPRHGPDWAERLSGHHIFVAEQAGALTGFMSIEPSGYVDFAYIRPAAQGSGLFRQLFSHVSDWAVEHGATELSTHASLMAQPAFAAMGFVIDVHETAEVAGEALSRARMIKTL